MAIWSHMWEVNKHFAQESEPFKVLTIPLCIKTAQVFQNFAA